MTKPILIICLALIGAWIKPLLAASYPHTLEAEVDQIYAVADETVKERLAQLDQSFVEYRFDPSVRRLIRMYVERWRKGTARILGRTTRYFPYFTEQLEAQEMPEAIKYLSITESALRPFAVSYVGAGGLWQLMPGTARELGLTVNNEVDERFDLVKGTEAGLRYLQIQYEMFGDWALAMAAYNSGPGRVIRAKRRSGSSNYWKLRRYLPRETSTYVPGFIAATYLVTYFSQHELKAASVDLDAQLTEVIPVYEFLSLHR
ncbi:MAG: lytic transglycosylase domain-containing protein, partial [Bacteroidota bacterium]